MSARVKFLALRDLTLFLLGLGLIVQQMLTGAPNPLVLEVGASICGVPGMVHGYRLSRRPSTTPTESRQPTSPAPVSLPEVLPQSGPSSTVET